MKVLRVNLGAVLPPSARIRIQNSIKGRLHARIQFESAGRRVGEIASVIFGQTVHGHHFG